MNKTIRYPLIKTSTILLIILSMYILTSGISFAANNKGIINQSVTQQTTHFLSVSHIHLAKGQRTTASNCQEVCSC